MSGNADARLSELELLNEAERRQLLQEWNDTQKPYDTERCIHQLFEQQAGRAADLVAVAYKDQQITYGELNRRANQVARYLQRLGVGPEVLVGIGMDRSLDMIVGLLGILKAGGAYLPLDPRYPQQQLRYMLEDAQAKVLLTQDGLLASLVEAAEDAGASVVQMDRSWAEIAAESGEPCAGRAQADNLAYVIYTSGSTGKPKGVLIAHRGLINAMETSMEKFGVDRRSRILQLASLSFDASAFEIFLALTSGARLHLLNRDEVASGPDLAREVSEHGITTIAGPPSLINLLPAGDYPNLQTVIVGAEPCSAETAARWSSGRRMFNGYGPTEATLYATAAACPPGKRQAPSIGRPITNTQVYLLDSYVQLVPPGTSGEIHIGGPGVARGYLNRPELTAEKFIPNPFGEPGGTRLYRSGDLGRHLSDGNVEFLGRSDQQVKIRGYRIEPGEIEAKLVTYPGIKDAIVVAQEDEFGKKRLVAYPVCEKDQPLPTVSDLREYLKARLPEYMIPSAFVMMDTMPLTANGKVDRKALPKPDSAGPSRGAYVAPQTRPERVLAQIWARLLRVKKVGVNDNFFELGGDSILSIQMISRAKDAGIRLTAKQIFQHQTIAELAAVAELAADAQAVATADQGPVSGPLPLTPIQRWFFAQQLTDSHYFNQAVFLDLLQPLDPVLLRQVLNRLVAHHDALRLRLRSSDGQWLAFNDAEETNDLLVEVDLSEVSQLGRDAAIEGAANYIQASLDLSRGPLLRAGLLNLGEGAGQRLLLVIHHLVVDGVSWRILLEDLHRAYQQARRGQVIDLGHKTVSFKQWAEHLQSYAASPELAQQAGFWQRQAQIEVPPLPVTYDQGDNRVEWENEVRVSLAPEQTSQLLQEAGRPYRTHINELLLTALARAYHR
ncbi:MAG TPA: amino acid adenylation domain-containing protein, partial [Blastocatellia bacterium]|nr:amino acid adenylation domain-containing protein [Blastocatellia bacterium]